MNDTAVLLMFQFWLELQPNDKSH